MLGSKRAVLIVVSLVGVIVAVAVALVIFVWIKYGLSDTPAKKSASGSAVMGVHPAAPAAPKYKMACRLVDDKVVSGVIGSNVVKNSKFTVFTTASYSSSQCEYTAGNTKASLILYQYPDDKKASDGKASAQTQVTVPSPDGRSSSVQPRQSVVGQKGKYVVSAAVTSGGTFDDGKSQLLLKEALEKL